MTAQNRTHPIPGLVRSDMDAKSPIPSTYAPARDAAGHALTRDIDGAPGFSRVEAGAGVATSIGGG